MKRIGLLQGLEFAHVRGKGKEVMRFLFLVLTFLFSFHAVQAKQLSCENLFTRNEIQKISGILNSAKTREAFLSEDQHFLKIVNLRTKTEYTFDSYDILKGFFSLDGHAWIIPGFDQIQIWNFERHEGNLIRVQLKHPESFPILSMHKDPANGHTILKIIYRREKINPTTRRFETVTETILKDLETFEESRI